MGDPICETGRQMRRMAADGHLVGGCGGCVVGGFGGCIVGGLGGKAGGWERTAPGKKCHTIPPRGAAGQLRAIFRDRVGAGAFYRVAVSTGAYYGESPFDRVFGGWEISRRAYPYGLPVGPITYHGCRPYASVTHIRASAMTDKDGRHPILRRK